MQYQLFTLLLLVTSCDLSRQNQVTPHKGFQYEVGGDTVAIVYESNPGSQAHATDLRIQVNANTFDISTSPDTGLRSFDGHGAKLNSDERKALAQAALDFSKQWNLDSSSPFEQKSLYLAFDYLSQAPEADAFFHRSWNHTSLQNEGVVCLVKGTNVKAQWNTRTAAYVAEDILVGVNWPNNYGCMGRCGSDCGWGAPSAWTKDCLDLDACTYRSNLSGSPGDNDCSDEFNEAADDWLGGVAAGCDGK